MRDEVEVAIVGAGLAGSALAAVLSARGVSVALCDLHAAYPADFRAEKLTAPQVRHVERLGFGDNLRGIATPIDELSIARFGRLVERRPNREVGIDYADLVNVVRASVPTHAIRVGRVIGLETAATGPTLTLGDGRSITARLAVLATGLGRNLIVRLGIRRTILEAEHCLAIGFDLAIDDPTAIRGALTYHGERLADRSAYLTLFPVGDRLRGNLFVYRRRGEDWTQAFRARPAEMLHAMMPGLGPILGDFTIVGRPVVRPIALYMTEEPERDGLVLVGDAFATTCPTGGTGLDKVLTDVERLAALVPGWLATGDISAAVVARFYDDPIKLACDANARRMIAYARAMAINPGLVWSARRYRNFAAQAGRDWLRRHLGRASPAGAFRASGSR